jgi:hypothetical protein
MNEERRCRRTEHERLYDLARMHQRGGKGADGHLMRADDAMALIQSGNPEFFAIPIDEKRKGMGHVRTGP